MSVGLLVTGVLAGVQEFLVLGSATSALLVVCTFRVWRVARTARRNVQVGVVSRAGEVIVGERLTVRVLVTNSGSVPVQSLLMEEPTSRWRLSRPGLGAPLQWPDGRDTRDEPAAWHASARRAVPTIAPGRSWAMSVGVPTERRGLLTLLPVRLWVEDPFGLAAVYVANGGCGHVVVCPVPSATR
ncbi:MAG TPA: hypothetical protein VEJ87_12265, partial [Acidimicrobiales bacterium]|nr:hypothetical protein [Acidimicrobiales bacterium]